MSALKLHKLQEIEDMEEQMFHNSDSPKITIDEIKETTHSLDTTTTTTKNNNPYSNTATGAQNSRESSLDLDDIKESEILNRESNSQLSFLPDPSSSESPSYTHEYNEFLKNIPEVKLTYPLGTTCPADPKQKVFFFDIDNCLYKRSLKIHDLMQIYIHRFFKKTLGLNDEDAYNLHIKYYKEYGLAIEGLVKYNKIDALEYNKVVDDALPLDKILRPNLRLRKMLIKLKESGKIDKLWLFTNAYKNHGLRVIRLLGIGDLFDGMTFCDYSTFPLICKPMPLSFQNALTQSGCVSPSQTYFIDDSGLNVNAAVELGWSNVIQYVERDEDMAELVGEKKNDKVTVVRDILDIEKVCPELFK